MPWFDDKERTEAPTPNKLQKAREKGNIPVSQELAGAVQALVAVAVLSACAHGALESLGAWLRTSLERELQSAPGSMGGASVVRLAGEAGRCIVSACGPLLGALACSAVAVAVAQQGGVVVSSERVRFDPTRLDPRKNLEKVLGPAAFARMAVTLLKLVLVGAVCFLGVRTAFLQLRAGSPGSLAAGVDATSGIVFGLLWRAAGLLLAVGALDLFLARRRHTRELRMTKQEVRDEHKELEGDPLRKAHIRRIQRENRKRRGMLAAVPTATVVVTNPTHYAVAIAYDRESMAAPKVVAKGTDRLALRIRELAAAADVPTVEDRPLARLLHRSVDVGAYVPPELYQAVAELLAFVYRLKGEPR